VRSVDCDLLVLSYNNESWLGMDELEEMCAGRGAVATLTFDSARYVGARIGIFDPSGRKVGRVSHLSNQELLVIAGEGSLVRRVVEAAEAGTTPVGTTPVGTTPVGTTPVGTATIATGAAGDVVAVGRADRLQQAT
jgi:adenine-specific DNA-methyltransferase